MNTPEPGESSSTQAGAPGARAQNGPASAESFPSRADPTPPPPASSPARSDASAAPPASSPARAVREPSAGASGEPRTRRRIGAAWTLALLTPAVAELTFTAVAVPQTWLVLPLLLVMYGAGVLLIREAVVRVRGGWASLVLLGVAYEIAEDGLGLQALTSPVAYGAADWGWRALGLTSPTGAPRSSCTSSSASWCPSR